jgi:hypothetical protein
LPIDNISVEARAAHVAALLRARIAALGAPHVPGQRTSRDSNVRLAG